MELKPCPFCGNKHVSKFMKVMPMRWRREIFLYGVSCDNLKCNARIQGFLSKKDAATAWNRRAWL